MRVVEKVPEENLYAPAGYQVSEGVYVCRVSGHFIVLDSNTDRYLCFDARQSAWFETVLAIKNIGDSLDAEPRAFADRLVDRGLLENSRAPGGGIKLRSIATPAASVYRDRRAISPRVSARHIGVFIVALCACAYVNKRRTFFDVVQTAKEWNSESPLLKPAVGEDVTRELALVFRKLAPYFITNKDNCRFRSLLLVKFMSMFGIRVKWVFGVRTAPFAAHCWVEREGLLLNDYLEQVQNYTPLMAV